MHRGTSSGSQADLGTHRANVVPASNACMVAVGRGARDVSDARLEVVARSQASLERLPLGRAAVDDPAFAREQTARARAKCVSTRVLTERATQTGWTSIRGAGVGRVDVGRPRVRRRGWNAAGVVVDVAAEVVAGKCTRWCAREIRGLTGSSALPARALDPCVLELGAVGLTAAGSQHGRSPNVDQREGPNALLVHPARHKQDPTQSQESSGGH